MALLRWYLIETYIRPGARLWLCLGKALIPRPTDYESADHNPA